MIDYGGGMIFPDSWAAGPPDSPEFDDEAERCLDCRLRFPCDGAADAHARLTGHQMGWPLSEDDADWPLATEENWGAW